MGNLEHMVLIPKSLVWFTFVDHAMWIGKFAGSTWSQQYPRSTDRLIFGKKIPSVNTWTSINETMLKLPELQEIVEYVYWRKD